MQTVLPRKRLELDYILSPKDGVEKRLAMVTNGNKAVVDFLRQNSHLDERAVFAFLIAYEELATNTARHAVRQEHPPVRLFVRITVRPALVSLLIKDDGLRFNPLEGTKLKTPGIDGGQGLNLINGYFPGARFIYRNGTNIVRIEMRCPDSDG